MYYGIPLKNTHTILQSQVRGRKGQKAYLKIVAKNFQDIGRYLDIC